MQKNDIISIAEAIGVSNEDARCVYDDAIKNVSVEEIGPLFSRIMKDLPTPSEIQYKNNAMVILKTFLLDKTNKLKYRAFVDNFMNYRDRRHEDTVIIMQSLINLFGINNTKFIYSTKEQCGSKYRSYVINQTDILELSVDDKMTIDQTLKKYLKESEEIDPNNIRKECRSIGKVKRKIDIICSNNYVLIRLNRSQVNLMMTPSELSSKITINDKNYDLIGVSYYTGTSKRGHYINYINYNGTIVEYNDTTVTQKREIPNRVIEFQTQYIPYVLLYKLSTYDDRGKFMPPGPGFYNPSASCYCNAALHLLLRTDFYEKIMGTETKNPTVKRNRLQEQLQRERIDLGNISEDIQRKMYQYILARV